MVCSEQLMPMFSCRIRRRFSRGLKRKPMALIKRLRKAKKNAPALEKPEVCGTVFDTFVMHNGLNGKEHRLDILRLLSRCCSDAKR